MFMDKAKTISAAAKPEAKKRGGRKPITAEAKATAAKGCVESKEKADNLKPKFVIFVTGPVII